MRGSRDFSDAKGPVDRSQTNPGECDGGHRPKILYVIGLGPGDARFLSIRAREILGAVDTVAGYTTYIDLIRPLIPGKKIIASGMQKEVERVGRAIDASLSGETCALVSSGDPGIYAMAGLVFEICRDRKILLAGPGTADEHSLRVEVVPGIPALCAGAALLGAPVGHDFAVISLSDLLTPWAVIEKRVRAAVEADFVLVLYNPKSRRRDWQLEKVRQIALTHRPAATPVGVVTGASRENQAVVITTLENLALAAVDMQTTVFIGNGSSISYLGHMFTPRGYGQKYALHDEIPA